MTRPLLPVIVVFMALVACRSPQTTEISYDASKQKLVAISSSSESKDQESKVVQTDGHVQVSMGIGDTIAVSVFNLPEKSQVAFTRVDLPREQVQMPTSWPLSTGSATTPPAKKPESAVKASDLLGDAKTATPPVHGDKVDDEKDVQEIQGFAQAREGGIPKSKKPLAAPAQSKLVDHRRLIGSLMREAISLSKEPNGVEAFKRLKEAEGLILALPPDLPQRSKLFEAVIRYEVMLLAGDKEINLIHHDEAAKALTEASSAIADGKLDAATQALEAADKAVNQFDDKALNKKVLLIRIADYRKGLGTPPTGDKRAVLPLFTYSGMDFDVRVEVLPGGSSATRDDSPGSTAISKGFFIHGRRDRDWMLFSSAGLALSRLVDDEYGIKDNGNTKTLIKLSSDEARGEFLVFLNFQNRGATGQAFPWLFGLGVGTTGTDMRYYLGPGVSLGNWGAMHLGLVGGQVKRLRENVDMNDYKGTDPSAELRSVFKTSYFFSITARF